MIIQITFCPSKEVGLFAMPTDQRRRNMRRRNSQQAKQQFGRIDIRLTKISYTYGGLVPRRR